MIKWTQVAGGRVGLADYGQAGDGEWVQRCEHCDGRGHTPHCCEKFVNLGVNVAKQNWVYVDHPANASEESGAHYGRYVARCPVCGTYWWIQKLNVYAWAAIAPIGLGAVRPPDDWRPE